MAVTTYKVILILLYLSYLKSFLAVTSARFLSTDVSINTVFLFSRHLE
jgi:hypothetical protein